MAHFAEIDQFGKVKRVIVIANADTADAAGVEKEHIGAAFCEKLFGGTWVQTSYNANFRKNYAGQGFTYDSTRDAFIPPKPFASWVLNEDTCQWSAPVPYPTDVGTPEAPKRYVWNEETQQWDLLA